MPVLNSQPDAIDAPLARFPGPAPGEAEETAPRPSLLETAAAAERTSNIVGQAYSRWANDTFAPEGASEPGFNAIDHIPQGYLHDYGARFLHAGNLAQIQQEKRQIDAERADQGVIARGGWGGVAASMAAGATDPLTLATMALVPEAAPTRFGNMLRWGLTNALTTAGQELVSQQLSETRTPEESLINVSAGAVLGGLLGGLARRVPRGTFDRLATDLHGELQTGGDKILGPNERSILTAPLPSDHPYIPPVGEETHEIPELASALSEEPIGDKYVNPNAESTAGAAEVKQTTLDQESVARGAKTLTEGPLSKPFPSLRVLNSPSVTARRLVQELANIPEVLEKNLEGIKTPQPVERDVWKQVQGLWYQGWSARRDAYQAYRERIRDTDTPVLSRNDFGEQVSAALRRGDVHAIPEVAKAAQATRSILFDPPYQRALKQGMLPEDAKLYADSYLTRQYDAPKIRGDYANWLKTLQEGFQGKGVEPAEASYLAHQASRKILTGERGTMDWRVMDGIVPRSGRLKGRTLPLPDTLLEPYLNNNIDSLTQSYLHSMIPELEMTERFGSRDMKDQLDEVTDEYARLKEQAIAKGQDAAPLEQRENEDLRDLKAMRDRLYGIEGIPKDASSFGVRAGRLIRAANIPLSLGSATWSHLPDIPNAIIRYGAPKTFAAIGKMLANSSVRNLAMREAQRLGAAVDMVMNVTSSLLGDYGSHSQFAEQRFMNRVARGFTIATGETPFITFTQSVTSLLANDEILRVADKVASGQSLPAYRMARLASAGLDREMLEKIAKQKEFTAKAAGLRFGMSDTWKDQAAAKAFESAVLKEAHGVTLRPGVGDTPLYMSGELGKLIGQFQSFGYAANRMVVNPLAQGLAAGDGRAVQGLFALMFMGSLSYAAKQKIANQPMAFDHPGRLALEVADKSNLLGWAGHYVAPALYQMGETDMAGWQAKNAVNTLLGPSLGNVVEGYEHHLPGKFLADKEAGEKGVTRSDLHFMRKMFPASRVWYLRRGVDHLEDAVGDLFDLPGTSNADRAMAQKQKQENAP